MLMWRILSVAALCVLACSCRRSPQAYVETGNKFFKENKFSEAELQYRNAIQRDPSYGEAFYRLATLQLERQKLGEALQYLVTAAKFMPDNLEIKVKLADVSLLVYSTASAGGARPPSDSAQLHSIIEGVADQLLSRDPNSFDGWRFRGALAMLDRKPQEAVEAFEKADATKPRQPSLLVDLSQALTASGRTQEGEKVLTDLIEAAPTFTPAYDVLYRQYSLTNRRADGEALLKLRIDKNPKESAGLLALARHYASEGKPAEVKTTLNKLASNLRDFPNAYLLTGSFYAGLRAWDQAIHEFQLGAEANKADPTPYQEGIINALLSQGKPDEAFSLVEAILKQKPSNTEARAVRASILANRGGADNLSNAQSELENLVKQFPANAELHFSLGTIYARQGSDDRARAEFQAAVQSRRSFVQPRYALAEIALRQGKPDEALRYTGEILRNSPGDPRARLLSAAGIAGQGKYAEARRSLESLLKEFPQYRDARLEMGVLATKERDYRRAEEIFRALYQPGESDVRPLAGLVETYLSQQQAERATQFLKQELERAPNKEVIRLLLASTAMQSGKPYEAIQQYRILLEKNPKSVASLLLLADAQYRSNDLAGAIATYNKVIELTPKAPRPIMLRAFLLEKAGRFKEAENGYRHVLELAPNNVAVMNNLAFLLSETGGNLDDALRLAKEAARRLPNQPQVADTLGWVYLKQNQVDAALRIFELNARKQPDNAMFRYHWGSALLAKGDKDSARRELSTALQKAPPKDIEPRIRALLAQIG